VNILPIVGVLLAIIAGFIVFLLLNKKGNTKMDQPATSSPSTQTTDKVNALDEMIKSKFKLFQGLRTEEEDKKIYDKIIKLCGEETLNFLVDNLKQEEIDQLSNELSSLNNEDEKIDIIQKYLSNIENHEGKLKNRLTGYLNLLYISSVKNLSNIQNTATA
jgi:biopolymer transport protein ExbD